MFSIMHTACLACYMLSTDNLHTCVEQLRSFISSRLVGADGWAHSTQLKKQLGLMIQQPALSEALLQGVTSPWRRVKSALHLHLSQTVSHTQHHICCPVHCSDSSCATILLFAVIYFFLEFSAFSASQPDVQQTAALGCALNVPLCLLQPLQRA